MHMQNTYASYQAQGCEISAGDPTQSLIYICLGVNDALNARTASDFGADAKLLSDMFTAQGYAVMFSLPFGVDASATGAYNSAQGNSTNALLVTDGPYQTALKNLAATNPSRIFTGADEYALVAAHKEYLADGLHQNRAGSVALAAIKGPSIAAVLRTLYPPAATGPDPYQSDYSNTAMQEVNFRPSAPGPLVATGLGTAIKPEGDLSYIVPGNMQGGRIVFERRIHLSGNAFLPVGKVDGLDANTAPVSTWQDLNVVNGVTYEWRAYALPKGDFNPAVFP